jgi:hypothetical protein
MRGGYAAVPTRNSRRCDRCGSERVRSSSGGCLIHASTLGISISIYRHGIPLPLPRQSIGWTSGVWGLKPGMGTFRSTRVQRVKWKMLALSGQSAAGMKKTTRFSLVPSTRMREVIQALPPLNSLVLANCGAEHHSRGHKLCSHSVVSQHFMEPESSLPRSQELSTSTYPQPDQSSPQHSILSLKGPS